jgi:ribonucleoside-diphosphate reductase alpha chain
MKVIKRDNSEEKLSFDKILQRIEILSNDLSVSADAIAQQVISRIYDGIKTTELDELSAQLCSSMIIDHNDYGILASRIIVSNHHKNTSPSFSETIYLLYNNKDIHGDKNPLVSDSLFQTVMDHKEKLNSYIKYDRDYNFDYFGFKTLEKSYLIRINKKIVERPQHLYMRVALGIHGEDFKDALETYDYLSQQYMTHATPTLYNAGTNKANLSSCFLLDVHDSIEGMYDLAKECAIISKNAGGIGFNIHDIRSKNSVVRGTNGRSSGIIPMLRVFNAICRAVDQGGKRNGSIAVYIEPHHPDIMEFLDLRKNHGNEEERCRDLFTAMWISDLFMKRVQENGIWSLMDPDECKGLSSTYGEEFEELYIKYENEKKYKKQVKAQDVWYKILESQIETGTPYMLYKDHINKKNAQKNLGIIKSSNLCVAPDTMIYTNRGYHPIKDFENKVVKVWNGDEFSETTVLKTGTDQRLMTVSFSNGMNLRCTPYHKFYIETGNSTESVVKIYEAQDLRPKMKIINYVLPTLKFSVHKMKYAYTHGLLCTGSKYVYNNSNDNEVYLNNDLKDLLKYIECESFVEFKKNITVQLYGDIDEDYFVPINFNFESKLRWLEGVIDSNGDLVNDKIVIISKNREFLENIYYLLQTIGTQSIISSMKIQKPNDEFKFSLSIGDITHLKNIGLSPKRVELYFNTLYKKEFIEITAIQINYHDKLSDTYCFNEPLKHKGIFNGILTGQCAEILLHTNYEDEIAVCNLASLCLPKYIKDGQFNHEELHKVAKIVIKNLNKVIDVNYYPLQKAKNSNLRHRPVALGVAGFSCVFAKLKIAFESEEAKQLNIDIFETIYHAALESSMELAKKRKEWYNVSCYNEEYLKNCTDEEHCQALWMKTKLRLIPEEKKLPPQFIGAYSSFIGSPAYEGNLQFDMWDVTPSSGRYNWNELKAQIKEHGLRNSTLLALMPTASTSNILGVTESVEGINNLIYKRKVLSGEFIIVNKHLRKELEERNLWNKDLGNKIILNNGSIQNIDEIPNDLKQIYKTVWEIPQKCFIDMAADRAPYIDQTMSMNLFFETPTFSKLTSAAFYGWRKGLKTGSYYIRSKSQAKTQTFGISIEKEEKNNSNNDETECTNCSA